MSDFKITGSSFSLHSNLKKTIDLIRQEGSARIGVGFGISSREDVETVIKDADFAIIGSAFVKATIDKKLALKLDELCVN